MKKYEVELSVDSIQKVLVEASNAEQAVKKVADQFRQSHENNNKTSEECFVIIETSEALSEGVKRTVKSNLYSMQGFVFDNLTVSIEADNEELDDITGVTNALHLF